MRGEIKISTHAPAGGATATSQDEHLGEIISTHAPAGGATKEADMSIQSGIISTHAPAGGATQPGLWKTPVDVLFLLTPLREGRPPAAHLQHRPPSISTHAPAGGATGQRRDAVVGKIDFYSRPCGRGDVSGRISAVTALISTHAPAGGATGSNIKAKTVSAVFLLTPLREGRPGRESIKTRPAPYFYSRPCGRGDDCWL